MFLFLFFILLYIFLLFFSFLIGDGSADVDLFTRAKSYG